MQARHETVLSYAYEMYEMRKHKPSPVAGNDVCDGIEDYRNLEYMLAKRDEIAERVEKGIAAVPGEKLRMLWAATTPDSNFMDPFKILVKRKVAVIFKYVGNVRKLALVTEKVYYGGRKLTPLETEAAGVLARQFGLSGARWVSDMMWICREPPAERNPWSRFP
ncbi:hypothetical protein ACFLVH_01290 [Chloroflexota bacterium]